MFIVFFAYFINARNKGGTLEIIDDGTGMNKEELVNGFMRLSSSDKIHNPISNKYQRIRAGRKGIGRFATQRLGNKLTIVTQKANLDYALKISIDWEKFTSDIDLSTISNSVEIVEKQKEEEITIYAKIIQNHVITFLGTSQSQEKNGIQKKQKK